MERADKKGTNMPKMRIRAKMQIVARARTGARICRLIFGHEKTPVLAYRSSFTQILKKGDV